MAQQACTEKAVQVGGTFIALLSSGSTSVASQGRGAVGGRYLGNGNVVTTLTYAWLFLDLVASS